MFKNNLKIPFLYIISLVLLLSISGCLNDNDINTSAEPDLDLLETAESYEQLSTFSEYADSLNLDSRLSESGTYTFFAPTNNAFSELSDGVLDTLSEGQLEEILTYHVADTALFTQQLNSRQQLQSLQGENLFVALQGNSVSVNNGALIGGDIRATDGALHAVNTVLFPDSYLDVFGIIAKRYDLNTMQSALEEAGMEDTLSENSGSGFTVFAPLNSAFEGVPSPENQEALQDTMEYYVVSETWRADEFQDSQTLETLNGQELVIGVDDTTITVNDSAAVTITNLEGTNGVVHIIDTFLAPPD